MCVLHSGHRYKKQPSEVFVKNVTTVMLLLKSRVYRTGMFLMHKHVTIWTGNAQGIRWEKRLSRNMSKTSRKHMSLRYSIENCILKGKKYQCLFQYITKKSIIWLRNPCSELVCDITNPVVVKQQENFPRKELPASNTATAGAEAGD